MLAMVFVPSQANNSGGWKLPYNISVSYTRISVWNHKHRRIFLPRLTTQFIQFTSEQHWKLGKCLIIFGTLKSTNLLPNDVSQRFDINFAVSSEATMWTRSNGLQYPLSNTCESLVQPSAFSINLIAPNKGNFLFIPLFSLMHKRDRPTSDEARKIALHGQQSL